MAASERRESTQENRLWAALAPRAPRPASEPTSSTLAPPVDRSATSLRLVLQDTERLVQGCSKKIEQLLTDAGRAIVAAADVSDNIAVAREAAVADLKNLANIHHLALMERCEDNKTETSRLSDCVAKLSERLSRFDEDHGKQVITALTRVNERLDQMTQEQRSISNTMNHLTQQVSVALIPILPRLEALPLIVNQAVSGLEKTVADMESRLGERINSLEKAALADRSRAAHLSVSTALGGRPVNSHAPLTIVNENQRAMPPPTLTQGAVRQASARSLVQASSTSASDDSTSSFSQSRLSNTDIGRDTTRPRFNNLASLLDLSIAPSPLTGHSEAPLCQPQPAIQSALRSPFCRVTSSPALLLSPKQSAPAPAAPAATRNQSKISVSHRSLAPSTHRHPGFGEPARAIGLTRKRTASPGVEYPAKFTRLHASTPAVDLPPSSPPCRQPASDSSSPSLRPLEPNEEPVDPLSSLSSTSSMSSYDGCLVRSKASGDSRECGELVANKNPISTTAAGPATDPPCATAPNYRGKELFLSEDDDLEIDWLF